MEYISWWDSAFFVSFYEIATGTLSLVTTMLIKL